jgi:molybdopterin-guanine dinucleotide biosynthesis adapter protein
MQGEGADMSRVLGVVGWSGSGKTTLLEYLVAQLAARGLRVNVIKHSHHDVMLEPPHKDSARMRTAGAAEVLLASPFRIAIVRELRGGAEPALAEHIARMAPADLTLVEGYKWEHMPKLEVHRPQLGHSALYPNDPHIVAVASDAPRPSDAGPDLIWLDLNAPDSVLAWLAASFLKIDPQVPSIPAVNQG